MNRAISYGLVLLAGSVAGAQVALAFGPGAAAAQAGEGIGALFFVGGQTAAHAQGYLGVDLRDVTADQLGALKLKEARGAEIVLVDHDAPAGKCGLREHDVVLQMNGHAITGEDQIRKMLRETAPGKTVVLVISRDGQQITVSAQMANRDEVERQAWQQHLLVPEPQELPAPVSESESSGFSPASSASSPPPHGSSFIGTVLMSPAYTGAMLEKMSTQLADYFGVPNGAGLLVQSVEANSPAALAGMRAGDVVVRANAQTVASTADWAKAIRNSRGHPLTVVVLRDKKEQTLTLTPDSKKRSSLELPANKQPANDPPADEAGPDALAHLGFSFMPVL
jgi:membrane-associated protease RseP (regulator of RpoE activity)